MESNYQYYFNYAKELQLNDKDADYYARIMLGELKESFNKKDEKMWKDFVKQDLADLPYLIDGEEPLTKELLEHE